MLLCCILHQHGKSHTCCVSLCSALHIRLAQCPVMAMHQASAFVLNCLGSGLPFVPKALLDQV